MVDASGSEPPETGGREILLYDYHRRPRLWSEIILPHQCAVFLRNRRLGVAINRSGAPASGASATCILFDSIASAEASCRAAVSTHPDLQCAVLDHEGPVHPPLLTIAAEHSGGDEDTRGWIGRHRRTLCVLIACTALPLFYYDFRHRGTLVLTVIGINLVVAALRLLMWDSGSKRAERERLGRLEEHRRREREFATKNEGVG